MRMNRTEMSDQHMAVNLHRRTVTVGVDVARAVLGVDAESVLAMIDSGQILWAWDIAARPSRERVVRIWTREIVAPGWGRGLEVGEVVDAVIGTQRPYLRSGELCSILFCSRAHVHSLVEAGEIRGRLDGHTLWVHRDSVDGFLRRRLAGSFCK